MFPHILLVGDRCSSTLQWRVPSDDIAERHREKLGESDKGIVLFRRLLQALQLRLERGDPMMNVFTDPVQAACVRLPLERHRVGVQCRPERYISGEGGPSVDADKVDAVYATWG